LHGGKFSYFRGWWLAVGKKGVVSGGFTLFIYPFSLLIEHCLSGIVCS
jgi:hypothetical protein